MKKDYALDFSQDRVRLMSRAGSAQTVLGEIPLDDPHFDTRFEDLRREVEAAAGKPVEPLLMIPHSEILFTELEVQADDKVARAAEIERQLDGLTPYALEDLVYDWKAKSKSRVQVAAVARATLDEAEAFALSHGFGNVGFGSAPKPGAFRGQADFGVSTKVPDTPSASPAVTRVADLEGPARSAEPVRETPADNPAPAQRPAPAPVDDGSAKGARPAMDDASLRSAGTSDRSLRTRLAEQELAIGAALADRPVPGDPTGPAPDPARAGTDTTPPKVAAPVSTSGRNSFAAPRPAPVASDAAPGASDAAPVTPVPAARNAASGTAPRSAASDPRPKSATPRTGTEGAANALSAGSEPAAAPKRPAETPAFASRRDRSPAPAETGADPAKAPRLGAIDPRIDMAPDAGSGPAAPVPSGRPNGRHAAAPTGPRGVAPVPTVRRVAPPDGAAAAPSEGPARVAPQSLHDSPTEAEQMTIFGARPRHRSGLATFLPVFAGVSVALILALAIWSAFFFLAEDTASRDAGAQSVAVLPPADLAAPVTDPGPIIDPETLTRPAPGLSDAADQTGGEISDTTDTFPQTAAPPAIAPAAGNDPPAPARLEDPATAAAPESSETDVAPDDPLRRPADATETSRYAATGVWTSGPSAATAPRTDVPQTDPAPVTDPEIAAQDSVPDIAPPDLAGTAAPDAMVPPAPSGPGSATTDPDRTTAIPEGTVTPDGVRVTAGAPAVRPPAPPTRPGDVAAADAPDRSDEGDLSVPVTQGPPPAVPPSRPGPTDSRADDALGDTRPEETRLAQSEPRARPGVADTQTDDPSRPDSALDRADPAPTAGAVRLAAFSPLPRPGQGGDAIDAAVEEAIGADADAVPTGVAPRARPAPDAPTIDAETDAADVAAVVATLAAIVPPPVETSPYAVARSLRPDARPRTFSRTVSRAAPVEVAAASATITPRTPTTGAVASRATQSKILKLNAMNLIGVYGAQSNRRALVRLPNGRFEKVKVGDRINGGRVRAIGQSDLQYIKGGRTYMLAMP